MEIGKAYINPNDKKLNRPASKNLNDLTPVEKREALKNLNGEWNSDWDNQQFVGQGLEFPRITSKYGNTHLCENDSQPDPTPPAELFNFDLILNGRRFQVLCDTILRIRTDEDLADFSETQILRALEMCSSYRVTCYCAYISAHREYRKWDEYHKLWMAEKQTEARNMLRTDRLADKAASLRKDLGQITLQEIEQYVLTHYTNEYKHNLELVREWEENEKVFLELRDTLKDRGMHLQSILKRVSDNIDKHIMGNASSTE